MRRPPNRDTDIHNLVDRLGRIIASDEWGGDLNPAQSAALSYLARANRFSRSPSVVAEYLGATRGTVSQTLKALLRKGLIEESPNPNDKRSISYKVTEEGAALADQRRLLHDVLEGLSDDDRTALESQLTRIVGSALKARGLKTFGSCKTCRHHRSQGAQPHCTLLDLPLRPGEEDQICVEQTLQ